MVSKPLPNTISTPIQFQLSEVSGYSTWGELLRSIRNHNNIESQMSQHDVADALNERLEAAGLSQLPRRAYGDLERGHGYPRFIDLEHLFRTFVCTFKVAFTDLEILAYVHLARARMGQKRKQTSHIKQVTESDWETLLETLFTVSRSKPGRVHLVTEAKADAAPSSQPETLPAEDPQLRRLRAIEKALRTDIRHLLEREMWVNQMLVCPQKDPQVKLVVVQGPQGVGKSRAQALLIRRLLAASDADLQQAADHDAFASLIKRLERASGYCLVPYLFETGAEKRSEDYLDEFLATILSDLMQAKVSDETKQRPLETRIDNLMAAIKSHEKKVVLLLDGAECMFPQQAGQWSPSWAHFFEVFAREPHTATMYVMTRVWAGMEESQYIEQTDLPELSTSSSISLWQRSGFDNVAEETLREVCTRCCGNNPQMITMLIAQCKKRSFALARWETNGTLLHNSKKSITQQRLEALLTQETMFDLSNVTSRLVLERALTSQISHQAKQMLECLACSPLGLPLSLLFEQFAHAEKAFFHELLGASSIDLGMLASRRAVLVPFIREAVLQELLADGRLTGIQARVTDLYAYWLETVQHFRDDNEKAALIAETVVRYIRAGQLLKAADLFVGFGWLCSLFGQVARLQRVFDEHVAANKGKEEDVNHEVGRLILQHHIGTRTGQEIDRDWRDQTYQDIYDKVLAGDIVLYPALTIEVMHHLLSMYLRNSRFLDASQMLEETLTRLQKSSQLTPEVYAFYLRNRARLFAQWWDKGGDGQDPDEVRCLLQDCVVTLKECIAQWRLCLKNTLPLQEQDYSFSLAKTLNDYAYRSRLAGDLLEAESAIQESLRLKKKYHALPHSMATSLGEYAQILLQKGAIRKALSQNQEACVIHEHLVAEGNTSRKAEWGVLLYERAIILKHQAHLVEARELLDKAIALIGNKPSRQPFRIKAEKEREEISLILETEPRYQLDKRWFSKYLDLASYNDVNWIIYAGPFSDEEQREWENLYPQHENKENSDRLKALIVQSYQREFALSQEEKRVPKLWYPYIPLEEVQDRISQFEDLLKQIELQEKHAIVRLLYIEAIREQILLLRRFEATVLGNQDTVWQCNLSLYGKPSTYEFHIALQSLCRKVADAQKYERIRSVAQEISRQLKSWNIESSDIMTMTFPVPPLKSEVKEGGRRFSCTTVQRFFQDVLREYRAEDWQVVIDPTRSSTIVNVDRKVLSLPPKSFSLEKVRDLLAEELETHIYRSLSGSRSPLALLSSGLAKYNVTEEGLAEHYTQQMNQQIYGAEEGKNWIGTLATGLASGVLTPALDFYQLASFLEKTFLIDELLDSGSTDWDKAVSDARERAWLRAARTFRGVPRLEESGCCSLKDVIYLRGFLSVRHKLEQVEEPRLFVGRINSDHLDMMHELDILAPFYPHYHIALAADLSARIEEYEK